MATIGKSTSPSFSNSEGAPTQFSLCLSLCFTVVALTPGYFAEKLSVAQEIHGNMTVKVKNESRIFHLNNLSYAGPIVMGFGGE